MANWGKCKMLLAFWLDDYSMCSETCWKNYCLSEELSSCLEIIYDLRNTLRPVRMVFEVADQRHSAKSTVQEGPLSNILKWSVN